MRTPLYQEHRLLGARMTEFAGWEMPLSYGGILGEHEQTRQRVSVFDTCHMSEFRVGGPRSEQALRRTLACRIDGLAVGRCRYGFLLNESGGVLDDLICYRVKREEFMIVANAGRREVDAGVLKERIGEEAIFEDVSDETAKIDLQGPDAPRALSQLAGPAVLQLAYYGCDRMGVAGIHTLVSRTGYTGELGYELYLPADRVQELWQGLLDVGGVQPAGLGARDTLRLEMGYPLYGHELDESTTPVEAGYAKMLPAHGEYPGAQAVCARVAQGVSRRLVGVRFDGRRAARPGDALTVDGEDAGRVTSGCFGPSVGRAIALGYVSAEMDRPGQEVAATIRDAELPGEIVELPFYRDGTARLEITSKEKR